MRAVRPLEYRPTPEFLLWCDLETTGLDPDATILEVAFVLTRPDLTELWCLEQVLAADLTIGRSWWPPEVVEMHTASGLLAAVEAVDPAQGNAGWVQAQVLGALGRYVGSGRLYLAGSGVSHFDARFIRRDFPHLGSWLHYATLDVGVLRRFFRQAGLNLDAPPTDQSSKSHRAMADIRQHLAEARYYRDRLREVFDVGQAARVASEPAEAPDRRPDGDHTGGRGAALH